MNNIKYFNLKYINMKKNLLVIGKSVRYGELPVMLSPI